MVKTYLKWVGNKSKLSADIFAKLPIEYKDYYEPFVGSASIFLNLVQCDMVEQIEKVCRQYYLCDSNSYLINCHKVVSDHLDGLKVQLKYFADHENEEGFYEKQRRLTTRKHCKGIRAAARLIYLNRRAYGGMWRVNSKGFFNVPKSPDQDSALWSKSIESCSKLLRKASICCSDYKSITPKEGDFVFLDPPYYPLSKSSNFTGYTRESWTSNSHEELMDFLRELDKKRVMFLMTNNRCKFIEDKVESMGLYMSHKKVHRFIDALSYRDGRQKKNRDTVEEVFITNYKQD